MYSTIRTLNIRTGKETEIKFYKPMAVPVLRYGSEIWTITKKQEAKMETGEMEFLWSVAGYTRKAHKKY
jgi:hypothetical protein